MTTPLFSRGPFQPGDIVGYSKVDGRTQEEHLRFFVIKYTGTVPASASREQIAMFTYNVILIGGNPNNIYVGNHMPRSCGAKGMISVPERQPKVPGMVSGIYSLIQRIE